MARVSAPAALAAALAALERGGLLLKQDKHLASVITQLAGEPLSSSWWSHPDSHHMYRVLSELTAHPDVLCAKLLLGKDTFVHRSLWPAFVTVVAAHEPWQMAGLSAPSRQLLARVLEANAPVRAMPAPVRELVTRLLVHTVEVHTASGRHVVEVSAWSAWAAGAGVTPLPSVAAARKILEAAAARLGAPPAALPWLAGKKP